MEQAQFSLVVQRSTAWCRLMLLTVCQTVSQGVIVTLSLNRLLPTHHHLFQIKTRIFVSHLSVLALQCLAAACS